MKLFIATPMSAFNKEEYNELREIINRIKQFSEEEIFAEITTVNQTEFFEPKEALKQDLKAIDESEKFIMIYPSKIHSSVLIELGYAIAKDKEILILTKDKKDIPYLAQDLEIKVFKSISELESILISLS